MRTTLFMLLFLLSANIMKGQITEIGLASFYADKYDGRVTASGEIFDQNKMTAAHRTLPFGSKVKVTNLENKKSIIVVINDRGPFVNDRVIDLSKAGAKKLDFVSSGVVKVKIEVLSVPQGDQKEPTAYTPPKPKKKANAAKTKVPISGSVASQALEYYKVESTMISPTGFGIQVASYKEAANLIKRCDIIKKSTDKDIIIQVGDNGGEKVYRIILGPFSTKEQASNYNKIIQAKFNGSFVIALK